MLTHRGEHLRDLLAVAVGDREQQSHQLGLQPSGDRRHHAEIDERELAVVGEQQVAGMGVGVQHALAEDRLEREAEQGVGEGGAVDVHESQRSDVGGLAPVDVLHRQHAVRAEVAQGSRNGDQGFVAGEFSEPLEVRRLLAVVEFVDDHPVELVEQATSAHLLADAGRVEHAGHPLERVHVLGDLLHDARSLHLHHDVAAGPGGGPVHLTDGRRGDGGVVEGREQVLHPGAEFLLDDRADILRREGLDVVLQPGEGIRVLDGQEVATGREQLAELDERGPESLEVGGEALRWAVPVALLGRHLSVPARVDRGEGVVGGQRLHRRAGVASGHRENLGEPGCGSRHGSSFRAFSSP